MWDPLLEATYCTVSNALLKIQLKFESFEFLDITSSKIYVYNIMKYQLFDVLCISIKYFMHLVKNILSVQKSCYELISVCAFQIKFRDQYWFLDQKELCYTEFECLHFHQSTLYVLGACFDLQCYQEMATYPLSDLLNLFYHLYISINIAQKFN